MHLGMKWQSATPGANGGVYMLHASCRKRGTNGYGEEQLQRRMQLLLHEVNRYANYDEKRVAGLV